MNASWMCYPKKCVLRQVKKPSKKSSHILISSLVNIESTKLINQFNWASSA